MTTIATLSVREQMTTEVEPVESVFDIFSQFSDLFGMESWARVLGDVAVRGIQTVDEADKLVFLAKGDTLPPDKRAIIKNHLADFASRTGWENPIQETYAYFVEAIGLNLVKIGRSADPSFRLEQLQHWSPVELRLLATIPERVLSEKRLHEAFADVRVRGEWFAMTKQLRTSIERIRNEFGTST